MNFQVFICALENGSLKVATIALIFCLALQQHFEFVLQHDSPACCPKYFTQTVLQSSDKYEENECRTFR